MNRFAPLPSALLHAQSGADDWRVACEKVDLLMRGFKLAILSTLTGPLLVAWLFEPFIGVWKSWGMVVVIYALHSERWFFFRRFNRARPEKNFEPQPWMRGVAVRLGVMGSALGIWTLAATASGSETAMFYALTLSAILSAGALTQFCIYPPVVIAFVTPFLLGSTAQMLWLALSQSSKIGWVSAVYLGVLWAVLVMASQRFGRVMHSDLAQRYRNEALLAEVQAQKELAEAASEAKSRFLAAASHDLRQPVHAVALLADALQQRSQDPQQQAILARLQGGVAHFSDVVDEVLDVARLDAGAVAVNWQAVPVQELLDRIDATYRELAQAKGLALLIRPCADSQAAVRADPALLWRVLSNLVGNAVRYTARGTVLVVVRRASVPAGQAELARMGWRFEVRDTGPGIALEQQALIFEEFYQLHNPQRDSNSGLGLGLAVARRMASLLQSQIGLISRSEQGATFSIALCADSMPASGLKPSQNQRKSTDLRHWAVIVVDDEQASREAMQSLLQSWGVPNCVAADSAEACSHLAQLGQWAASAQRVALLTDHWLAQGEDAFSVGEAALAICPDALPLHIAVFTGDISPELRERVTQRGWFFSPKPVRPLVLRMWLESLHGEEIPA
jgi:two-component system, sensor histidine kinase